MATELQKAVAGALKTGGAANAASSSGTSGGNRTVQSVRDNAAQKRAELAKQELQRNPASQMTARQKQLVRGLIAQHPEAINNLYTKLGDSYNAVYQGLASGNIRTQEQLGGVKSVLDAVQQNIRSLGMLKAALGVDSPQQINLDLDRVQNGYEDMMRDYQRLSDTLASPMMQNVAQVPGMTQRRTIADPVTGVTMVSGGVTAGLNRGQLPVMQQQMREQQEAAQAAERERQRIMSIDSAANRAEADRLEAIRDEGARLYQIGDLTGSADYYRANGLDPTKSKNIYQDLTDQANTLRTEAAQGERLRTQTRLTEQAMNAADFGQYTARGAAVQNPTAAEVTAMAGSARKVESRIGNIVTWSRENRDAIQESLDGATGRVVGDVAYSYMTDDEVSVYNYYIGKGQKEIAQEYLDSIMDELHFRQAAERYSRIEGKTGVEILTGIEAGLDQFGAGIRGVGRMITGDDSYTPGSVSAYLGGMAREGLADAGPTVWKGKKENTSLGQVAYDLTQTTSNMLPSILASTAANAILPGSGEIVGAVTIGASAGGNAYEQMINLGYTKKQAQGYALLTGASEAGLQYLIGGVTQLGGKLTGGAVERILVNVDNAMARTAIKLGSELVSEGVEEYLQDVLEPVFRNIALGEHNTINPLSREALYSGVLGGVSALLMSGGGTVRETMQQRQLGLQLQRTGMTAQRLAEVGQALPADSVGYRLANRIDERTGAYTMARLFNEIGATLTDENIRDIQAALVEKGVTERDAQELAMELAIAVANPDAMTQIQRDVLEKCSVAAEAITDVLIGEDTTQTENATEIDQPLETAPEEEPVPERLDNDLLTRERDALREAVRNMDDGTLLTTLGNTYVDVTREMHEALNARDFDRSEAYARIRETLDGAVAAANEKTTTAEKAEAARNYINNELGGIDNGTAAERAGAPVSDAAGRRDIGMGPGVEAGRVRPVGYGTDGAASPVRGGNGRVFNVEVRQTPAELNIPNGSETSRNGIIPADSWDEGMRNAAEMTRRRGYEMTYVTGPIEVTTKTGRTKAVNGVVFGDRVVVQADSRLYSPEQITEHEMFHDRVSGDPALLEDLKERFVRDHSAEELREIITRYAQIYDFCYGEETEGLTTDERAKLYDLYLEEYFADAAGGINRARMGSRGASRDTSATREVIAEREGMGNGSGGMPGARYAMTDEEKRERWNSNYTGPRYTTKDLQAWAKITVADTSLFDRSVLSLGDKLNKARVHFKEFARKRFPETVRVAENGKEIAISSRGISKFLSGYIPYVKYASGFHIPELLENAHREGERENYHPGESKGVPTYEYYLSPIQIDGKDYMAYIRVRNTNMGDRYYGHTVSELDKIEVEPSPRTSQSQSEEVQPVYQDDSTDNSISDSSENSNTEFGLRSNIPGFTEADRRAEARGEREAQAAPAPVSQDSEETVNQGRFSVAEEETERKAVEDMDARELRRAVAEDKADIAAYEKFLARDIPEDIETQMRAELAEIRERLGQEQARVREFDKRAREERKAAQERAAKRQRPTTARNDFIQRSLDLFSVKEGRQEIGNMIGQAFDDARSRGVFSETDRARLFEKMLESGSVSAEADPAYRNIRDSLSGTRIFVPDDIRENFGENYPALMREAFGQGIYLTTRPTDNHIDVLNQELAEMYPGTFRADDTDLGGMLENIIEAAKEGRAENLSLREMMGRVAGETGWSVDDQLYDLERKFDAEIDKAMYAAGIEVQQKARGALQLAREQERHREILRRQSENRQVREMQQRTMKALQWLKKNRNRAPQELRARFDEITDGINLLTMSAANEMRWSDRHQATYGDLARMYKDAKTNDPNWMPSKELDELISKLEDKAIADMTPEEIDTLYKAASALRTEFYNRNNLINDEMHRTFSEVFDSSTEEIRGSDGRGNLGKGLAKLTNREMMTPMNILEMMGGWKNNGQFYSMAKQLQAGERRMKGYVAESKAMLEEWTRENQDWIRTADGQGKDAVWYEVEVPELLELHMGDKPIFGNTVKVYMTPMQKVQLYLESKNYQNLQHMTGGRTFVNRELYSKGERSEALAQGTTVRLAPESVKRMVSDLTAQEMELANLLERYYNEKAKNDINAVSNPLYGYDKAMIDYYAPIFTDSNYNKSTAGLFDVTAEGVGHMKSREQVSKNPSYNLSAIDAFERHVDQTSRFVGLAIPIRNMETLMNWYGDGTTMKKEISAKWGKEGLDYITDLMTRLQSPQSQPQSVIGQMGDKLVSNYITAVFGMNPGVVFKQAASYPAAAAVLGFENLPSIGQMRGISEDLINRYTPELAYRKLGYATPEIAQMRNNPSWLDRNKFTRFAFRGGAIQWMDTTTVKNLWAWAENYVRKMQPDLETGTREMINAGQSPFYRAVADAFNEAVNITQPMYDTMNRANIMNDKNALVRTLTLFKTVPLQEYNTLRKYIAQAKGGDKAARRQAGQAVASILASTVMLEGIAAAFAWLKNGLKGYRDDDDELTAESFAKAFAMNMAGDLAGIMIGGSEIFEAVTHKMGMNSYSSDFQIVGTEQIKELRDAFEGGAGTLYKTITGMINVAQNGGDVGQYLSRNKGDLLSGIHELAAAIAKYAGGLPVDNTEKYLGGILAKVSPELKAALEGAFDTTTKDDLKYIEGPEMATRLNSLLNIRNIDVDDGTTEELVRLYQNGYKTAVPTDTPDKINVNGEERELSSYEMQTYDNAYTAAIGKSLDALVESETYIRADDKTRAKMLDRLYEYARQTAERAVAPDYEGDKWTVKAAEAQENGVPAEAYIALQGSGLSKNADKLEFIEDMDLTDEQKGVLYYYGVASDARQEDMDALRDVGMDWGMVYKTMNEYLDVDQQDMSANMKAATFMSWAYDNLDAEETTAALENLTFSSGFKASPEGYQKLVDAGLDPDDALEVYGGWGALQPEGDATSVTNDQKIRMVAESDMSQQEKVEAIGVVLGTNMTTDAGNPSQWAKMQNILNSGLDLDDYMEIREAGAINKWQKMSDAGLDGKTAMDAAIALQELKPPKGEDYVTTLQQVNAITKAVSGNDNQIMAMQAVLVETQAQKLGQAADHGITAKTYADFLNTIQNYYAWDPSGSTTSLSQKECQAALDSMDLTLYDKAVLWQIQTMGKDGKNNPYSTGVGKEIYDGYQAWKSEEESKPKESSTEDENAGTGWTGNGTSNWPGLQLPTVDDPDPNSKSWPTLNIPGI